MEERPAYKRILLKLSGEALMGADSYGINRPTIERIISEISDVVRLGDLKFRRATYPKGWRFSTHMGADRCYDTHVGFTISGRMSVELQDGTRLEFEPGSAFIVPAGHEAWVVGEEPCTIVQIDEGESAAQRFNVEQRTARAA